MSLLNVNLAILAYADAPASATPLLRLADLKWSLMGLPTENFRNIPLSLAPGETSTIASVARSISISMISVYEVSSPQPGIMRISGDLGQRIGRFGVGADATSEWAISKNGDIARATYTGNGTAPSFANLYVGDGVTFSESFGPSNQGDFTVVSKGPNYIDFINKQALEETTAGAVRFYSPGPVQKGDILDISSDKFSYSNRISAPIFRVNDQFIEVPSASVIPETVTGVYNTGLNIYPSAYKWLLVAVDHKAIVGLNGEEPTTIEVEPHVEGDLSKQPGLFMKRGKVFEVRIKNPGLTPVQGFVILAE